MAPVKVKFVVSFSSQDAIHTVQNLVESTGSHKWLSRQKEKTGILEATFQLEEPCVISSIDIGCCWCATIEIQVGKSDWPLSQPYRVLTPTASLMTPGDCRTGKNSSRQRTLASDDFSSEAAMSWDRIRVILRQPFRKDVQFGMTKLSICSNEIIEAKNAHHEKLKAAKFIEHQKCLASVQQIKSGSTQSMLQSKLLNIAASSEEGTKSASSLTRTAKLVLAAADNNIQKYPWMDSPSTKKSALVSNLATKVQGPSFDEEVSEFLQKFEILESDLETITVADIRHKFERKKKRKLTLGEKRLFMDKSKVHICALFDKDSPNQKNTVPARKLLPKTGKACPNINEMSTPIKRKTVEPLLPDDGYHPKKRTRISSPSCEDVNPRPDSPASRLCSNATTNIRNVSRDCHTPKGIHDGSGDTWLSKDIGKEEYSQNKSYRTPSPAATKGGKRRATKTVLSSGTVRKKNDMKSLDIENDTALLKGNATHTNKWDSNSRLPVYNTPNKSAINMDTAIVISETLNCDLVERFADVPCPLCGRCFPVDVIQIHADICSDPRYGEQVY